MLCLVLSLVAAPALGMTVDEREALDLSAYTVTDTRAGYFDIAARRAELARTNSTILLGEMAKIRLLDLCTASKQLPFVSGTAPIPRFYADRDGWRVGVGPFQDFETMVSRLAGQQFVAQHSGAGTCLIDMLDRWAAAQVFLDVNVKSAGRQTWFQTESSLFAAALAYSIVRDDVPGRVAEKQRIEDWLVAAANSHLSYKGAPDGACCNNHFYRRAVYAAMIGVLAGDDALFRVGVSAVYSALADAGPEGALRLEMMRGEFSGKYQVYAMMHLAMVAQIAMRQGYDLYALRAYGHTLAEIADFALGTMLRPETAADAARTQRQDTTFLNESQYYVWLELLAGKPGWSDIAHSLLAGQRPTYNRALGGYMSLFFMPTAGGPSSHGGDPAGKPR
jgi:poly(beta-D-mannuronate) lyase